MSSINPYKNSEDYLIEQPTIKIFEKFNWETHNAFNEFETNKSSLNRSSRSEVILFSRLKKSLIKLNPNLNESIIADAIEQLSLNESVMSPFKTNEKNYKILKDGLNIKVQNEDGENYEKVKIIDWDNPENNDFLLVSQLWIVGEYHTRRPDLIGFVNGIPLLIIELKNTTEPVESGFFDNITDYKDTIPQLFNYNSFIIISNGSQSKIGSTTATWEHYSQWKKINNEGEEGLISLDTLLKATCSKKRFLDIIENYILFSNIEGSNVKILCKNHQYLGVENALENFENKNGKIGVFWHTQGSGKSISMMFLSQKILRKKKGNWTFIIVTDRKELDNQIYKNFLNAKIMTEENTHAESSNHLNKLLSENHRFIFTLIHKFSNEIKPVSERKNLIVMVDEAHRTQYDSLALNMRTTLPNASFIAFTGTPLISSEEKTKEVFGDYISKYDFKQSVNDNATVPLYYENRIPELQISNDHLNDEMEKIIEDSNLDDEQMKKVEQKFANNYKLITDNDRIEKISQDIVEHFMNRGNLGKAMVVCIDKATTIKMFNKFEKHWNIYLKKLEEKKDKSDDIKFKIQYMKETDKVVVVSQSQNEIKDMKEKGLNILQHRERMNKEDLDTNFKDPSHPLRIAFVCSMWLTGFDVPSCSTLYLDKPMKNHTLMQAIARVNRVHRNKINGTVVDYIGVLKNLQKALSIYGSGDNEAMPIVDKTKILLQLEKNIIEIEDFCKNNKINIKSIIKAEHFSRIKLFDEAVENIVGKADNKKKFLHLVNVLWKNYKSILPEPKVKKFKDKLLTLKVISKKIRLLTPQVNVKEVMEKVDELLENSIDTSGYLINEKNYKDRFIDLSEIDFDKLKAKFKKNKNTQIELLKNSITDKLNRMLKTNHTRVNYNEKLQKLIDDYNTNSVNTEEFFILLTSFVKDLNIEEKRHLEQKLSEEELVVFDILTKPHIKMTDKETNKVKKIAKQLLKKLKNEKITLDWRKKQAARASVVVSIKDELTNLPKCYDEVYEKKCDLLYQHIYENYFNLNQSNYN
jgi:type I restriction enzyme, R subunit